MNLRQHPLSFAIGALLACTCLALPAQASHRHPRPVPPDGSTTAMRASQDDNDNMPPPAPSHWPEAAGVPAGTVVQLNANTSSAMVGTWQSLIPADNPPFYPSTSLQLTNGDVMIREYGTPYWWALHPDATGNYLKGTLTKLAPMPNGYAPLYECHAVLADGRVVVFGGEYLFDANGNPTVAEANEGAIYDPQTNTWGSLPSLPNQPLTFPNGKVYSYKVFGGDNSCVVMPNGQLLLASNQYYTADSALLDPKTLTWTVLHPKGLPYTHGNLENGWTLLPDGSVFTLDVEDNSGYRYLPPWLDGTPNGAWIPAGTPPVQLSDPRDYEIGPGLLRPDGTVLVVPALGGNTAVYTPPTSLHGTGSWSASASLIDANGIPQGTCDGPGSVLPDGTALLIGAPECYAPPSTYFSLDPSGTTASPLANQPAFAAGIPTFIAFNLTLPTGQVLVGSLNEADTFTPSGSASWDWAPVIMNSPNQVTAGTTFAISGYQFNGLTQGSYYGDDGDSFTNYPLVRVTYRPTGAVSYLRTHDHTSMGVATGSTLVGTQVDIPANMQDGPYDLVVVANGIASQSVKIQIHKSTKK